MVKIDSGGLRVTGLATRQAEYVMMSVRQKKGGQAMELRQRLYDVNDLWELAHNPDNDSKRFELIDGELIEMVPPGGEHGELSLNLGSFIRAYVREHDLGRATVETGYHPPGDRRTLLSPDVAFISHARAPDPFPKRYVPVMPDLAVEILSPTDTLPNAREKAHTYLSKGTNLVWIVQPDSLSVEVLRMKQDGGIQHDVYGRDDSLSGEDILPGFTLDVRLIFE